MLYCGSNMHIYVIIWMLLIPDSHLQQFCFFLNLKKEHFSCLFGGIERETAYLKGYKSVKFGIVFYVYGFK